MENFKDKKILCYRVYKRNGLVKGQLERISWEQLSPGDVTIKVLYSSINYKDALAATGQGKILRQFPLIPGIDAAGIVLHSSSPLYSIGQEVLVTGCGLGEVSDGGFSEIIRVPNTWIVPLPPQMNLKDSMIIGTAGFTAALCLYRMQLNGLKPNQGPLLITGASGGVGQLAIQIFSQQNYHIVAMTGKAEQKQLLLQLGAKEVILTSDWKPDPKPLHSEKWSGIIDNVGGPLLSSLLPQVKMWGSVASVGMAGGSDLMSSLFPFILRGVSLLGISSTHCPRDLRQELWKKLASQWHPHLLSLIHNRTLTLSQLETGFQDILSRKNVGRILVTQDK